MDKYKILNIKVNDMNKKSYLMIERIFHQKFFWIFIFLFLISNTNILAQNDVEKSIPNIISFQGIITNSVGNSELTGDNIITFNLYTDKIGGTPVWSETHKNVNFSDGKFQVLFGNNKTSNPLNIPFNKKYFIGIQINGQKEVDERIELVSTPYSLGSKFAQEVADSSITTEKFANLSVTSDKISDVSISKFNGTEPDPYSIYWTIDGNYLYGPERNYLGTIEEKSFVLKSFSVQRMRFDPYGHVLLGTIQDSVDFEVIGFSTFSDDMYIKGKMGVGIDTDISTAKVHINSNELLPFRVDYNSNAIFTVDQNGHVIITSSADGSSDNLLSYPLFVDSKSQGIAIQVKGAGLFGEAYGGTLNSGVRTNSFVTFFDDFSDGRAGRIAGENLIDYALDAKNIAQAIYLPIVIVAEGVAIANATSFNGASILSFGAEIVEIGAQTALELSTLGVSYRSGFADYAEWLERINPYEVIEKGEIVGVFGGKISKSTVGADQILCVSFNPIVLGNMVQKVDEPFYEKVTFLGQVPVKVLGKVNAGDYIITSGLEDGSGIAIASELMTIDEYTKVVGRAWESSNFDGIKYINTAVGFNSRDIINVLKEKDKSNIKTIEKIIEKTNMLSKAKEKISELNKKLDELNIELTSVSKDANEIFKKNNSITVKHQQ